MTTTVPQVPVGTDLPIRATFTVNEEQSLTATGTWTAGTFTLTAEGETTRALPWNATAQDVQAALEALSAIGPGGVTATGGPLPAAPVYLTFAGAKTSGRDATQVTADTSALTGSSPGLTVATVRGGGPIDPTVVTFTITPPGAASVTRTYPTDSPATITRLSLGCYETTIRVTQKGRHTVVAATPDDDAGAAGGLTFNGT